MNKKSKLIMIFSVLLFIFTLGFSTAVSGSDILKINDSSSRADMPGKYRDLKEFNMSGSAQFTVSQLPNVVKAIDSPKILDIDLRQESHGFINNVAFSYAGSDAALNYGMDSNAVLEKELNELEKIALNSEVEIHKKNGELLETLKVKKVLSEYELASKNNVEYIRLAVKDGGIPSEDVVDNFINIVKNKPKSLHIHFHCDHGEGRTTTFMAMYQIMNNESKLTLDEILKYQINNGGIVLTNNKERAEFLVSFYNYVNHNKADNYDLAYSNWVNNK